MTLPLAWITGAGGLIGSHLVKAAPASAPGWRVRGLTRNDCDLADHSAVAAAFVADQPALVIHCAAITRNPVCEADPALARRINVEVTHHLSRLSASIPFVFLSTDLVFDGLRGNYTERDPVNPQGVYARSKVDAEELVLSTPRHTVVRTSLNAGRSPTGDRSFTEDLHRQWSAGHRPTLFTDEFRAPLFAGLTARAIWELVQGGQAGLFHVAGSERLSRFEIGRLVARAWPELDAVILPATRTGYRGPPRPPDTTLDCSKAQAIVSFPLPRFSDWLAANPL